MITNLISPIRSSTLLPKIQRNSMLPPTCSRLACRNIEVIRVPRCRPAVISAGMTAYCAMAFSSITGFCAR